jgi:hypothetical protein
MHYLLSSWYKDYTKILNPWGEDDRSTSQESRSLLGNPKVYVCVQKSPPLEGPHFYIIKILFNNIIPFMSA